MSKRKKAHINKSLCVACGCCVKACPKSIIKVVHGLYAEVNESLCIGCERCKVACPASVIEMEDRTDEN